MKHLLLTILFLLPIVLFSQNYSELMAASAGNVFYSTNKNYFITEYLTEPENHYIFFFKGDSTDYNQIYFQNKLEISSLFATVVRSIELSKDIIYRGNQNEWTIINITNNLSKVKVGNQIFSIDLKNAKMIVSKFTKSDNI